MESKIYLKENFFVEKETPVLQTGTLSASLFTYDTGVKAVRLQNEKGYLIMLPFMGQMIWRMNFLGKELTMKSIHDQPLPAKEVFGETYGCFMMHCGLSAMGNPTAADTHLPHGELPVAKYDEAYLVSGEDKEGKYIGLGGKFSFKRCFEHDYDFCPLVKLYEGETSIKISVTFTNHRILPLEYFYLCHVNHRPVDGAKLVYTADPKKIVVHHEVPDGYYPEWAAKTNAYLNALDKDPSIMNEVGANGQFYAPEIVFNCTYTADEEGKAYTMQVNPDGMATYVVHRPDQLPFGVRWIARTGDEEAMGMVLPATAEHKGYLYCKEHGYEKYLPQNESVTYNIETGILTVEDAKKMQDKIKKMGF